MSTSQYFTASISKKQFNKLVAKGHIEMVDPAFCDKVTAMLKAEKSKAKKPKPSKALS